MHVRVVCVCVCVCVRVFLFGIDHAYRLTNEQTSFVAGKKHKQEYCVCLSVCCVALPSIFRANRLTNERTSVAAGKNQSPPKEANIRRTEGKSPECVRVRVRCTFLLTSMQRPPFPFQFGHGLPLLFFRFVTHRACAWRDRRIVRPRFGWLGSGDTSAKESTPTGVCVYRACA